MSQKSFFEGNAKSQKNAREQSCYWKCNYHLKEEDDLQGIYESIESTFSPLCIKYVFGEEYGKSQSTPHIEGYLIFKKKTEFNPIQKLFKFSDLQKSCKKNSQAGIDYCLKEGNSRISKGIPLPLKLIEDFYPYQSMVLAEIATEPDDRSILWLYGKKNIGKTQLLKYLCAKHGAHILPTSKKHALAQVFKTHETAELYAINLTADESSYQKNELFSIIEAVKDGMFSAAFGTECNGMCLFNSKHIVIMANKPPDFTKTEIDKDRFKIYEINEKREAVAYAEISDEKQAKLLDYSSDEST